MCRHLSGAMHLCPALPSLGSDILPDSLEERRQRLRVTAQLLMAAFHWMCEEALQAAPHPGLGRVWGHVRPPCAGIRDLKLLGSAGCCSDFTVLRGWDLPSSYL